MEKIIQRADKRGKADYGWLKARYSFSFANYYNPDHISFGALRVLNDDIIGPGMGFGVHPHENMEIITVPLEGALKHKDSMTNEWKSIVAGEVQVMSAGTGIMHSEMNNSKTEPLKLFQIWILPNKEDVIPSYEQKKFQKSLRKNNLQHLVSSVNSNFEDTLKVHQDVLISRLDMDENTSHQYLLNAKENGLYIMVIDGHLKIGEDHLQSRDAIGISKIDEVDLMAEKYTELLLIEVPM